MSNFYCSKCGTAIIDSPNGYVTGCEHYPLEEKKYCAADCEQYNPENSCCKCENGLVSILKKRIERLISGQKAMGKFIVKRNQENLRFREALEKILNDDDKPSCVNDDDCPLNGGDGFDNHCDINCPFIIAKVALEGK